MKTRVTDIIIGRPSRKSGEKAMLALAMPIVPKKTEC